MRAFRIIFGLALILCAFGFSFNDATGLAPPLVVGFLGGLLKKIGGAVKSIGKIGLKAVGVIPGVGTVVAGGAAAISAILGGGTVVAEEPGVGRTVVAAPGRPIRRAGFADQVTAFKIAGVPVIPVAIGGALLWFLLTKVKG
jgi:hypothetical protein